MGATQKCIMWEKTARHTILGERQNPSPEKLICTYAYNIHMHMYTCNKDEDYNCKMHHCIPGSQREYLVDFYYCMDILTYLIIEIQEIGTLFPSLFHIREFLYTKEK